MTILEWMRLPKDEWKPATAVFGWMHPDRETAMEIERQIKALESQNAALVRQREELADAAEMLWVVLANVSGGDWTKQTDEWQKAARRWADNYLQIKAPPSDQSSKMTGEEDEPSSIVERGNEQIVLTEKGVFFNGVPPEKERDEAKDCPHREAVYWNEFNKVVQCHKCGQTFTPDIWALNPPQGKTV